MSQSDFGTIDTSTVDGVDLAAILENFRDALHSLNSGSSTPGYAVLGTLWLNTSASPYKITFNDGTDDIVVGEVDPTANTFKPYFGTTIAGALAGKATIDSASLITDGVITGAKLVAGTITETQLGADCVGSAEIKTSEGDAILDEILAGSPSEGFSPVHTGGVWTAARPKVAVSADDTTPDYLENKITDSADIDVSVVSGGGDEELNFAIKDNVVDLNHLVHQTADTLLGMDETGAPSEITAGTNITIDSGVISASGGLASVSQGDLNTSTGTVSVSCPSTAYTTNNVFGSTGTPVALPGGQYGFVPESRSFSMSGSGQNSTPIGWSTYQRTGGTYGAYINMIGLIVGSGSGNFSGSAQHQQRYVTASAPWDWGDGELHGFTYLLVNSQGEVVQHYAADVPPWGYNGPTDIFPDYINLKTGKKFRRRDQGISFDQVLGGAKVDDNISFINRLNKRIEEKWPEEKAKLKDLVKLSKDLEEAKDLKATRKADRLLREEKKQYALARVNIVEKEKSALLASEYEEITLERKMADMSIMPHPFDDVPEGYTVVLLDPLDERMHEFMKYQNRYGGYELVDALYAGKFYADNEELSNRGGVKLSTHGVMQAALKIK